MSQLYVTGSGKTDHVRTRIEIHFITGYHSHTNALSFPTDTPVLYGRVCFYERLISSLVERIQANRGAVSLLGGINKAN